MSFAGKVWRLLVGIKDALALAFLLLFFVALFAVLSSRPNPGAVRDGALLLHLSGVVVEEASQPDPLQMLLGQQAPVGEYPARDLVRALDAAVDDERVKAVVLDLSSFLGGGQVHLQEIGEALDRVKAADKPVLAYGFAMSDDAYLLAAHASEVWLDPQGFTMITGPGGNAMFYAGLIEKLGINAHVYRVGTFKSAIEPYTRSSFSDPARENYDALLGVMFEEWKANVTKARPNADIAGITTDPVAAVEAARGDLSKAALTAGLIDKLGSKVEFGQRVAAIVGEDDWDDAPGAFAHTELEPWLADNPLDTPGKTIGVITVAGNIVDGDAGPATAGGDRISKLLDDALDDDLAGLVIRVDSPGGSALASEEIHRAVLRHKAKGIPIAVSMANVAASGGYWVATPGDRIFAQPETVTGSIGIFAVTPTFERTAAKLGITTDGVTTTPLSGQPSFVAGFTPELDTILQAAIEDGYRDFIGRVVESRGMTFEQVDTVAQGRVWDGGTARQLGLVDQFGGLEDALAWTAEKAGLEADDWHAEYLGVDTNPYDSVIRKMIFSETRSSAPSGGDVFTMLSQQQARLAGRLADDLERLAGVSGMQAYCLECPRAPSAEAPVQPRGWIAALARLIAL